MHHRARSALGLLTTLGVALTWISGCNEVRDPRIVTPGWAKEHVEWTDAERRDFVASKLLHSAAGTSTHALRLNGAHGVLASQVHDVHDLTVVMLSGSADVRLGGKYHRLSPGDIVEVPRGSVYFIENLDPVASEFYEIFYPPYDGKDMRMVTEGGGH